VLAREGATLLLVDRNLAAAQETAAMIAGEGGRAECLQADWTDPAACAPVARRAKSETAREFPWHQDNGYTFVRGPRRTSRAGSRWSTPPSITAARGSRRGCAVKGTMSAVELLPPPSRCLSRDRRGGGLFV